MGSAERVDRVARERGTSRSPFLQECVRRELGWPDPVAFDAALERGRSALEGAGAFEGRADPRGARCPRRPRSTSLATPTSRSSGFTPRARRRSSRPAPCWSASVDRTVSLSVLHLTAYELGSALLRGRLGVAAERVAEVLEALAEVCPAIVADTDDLREATALAEQHGLTLYDAAYAAVARRRGAHLVTLDGELLGAGLGRRPSELIEGRARDRPRNVFSFYGRVRAVRLENRSARRCATSPLADLPCR